MPQFDTPRPPIRWVGGKRRLLPHLTRLMPPTYRDYYEPFLGGGALFWHTRPARAFLSDIVPDITNLYTCLRDEPQSTIDAAYEYYIGHDREWFYAVRDQDPQNLSPIQQAGRYLYLNKASYLGRHRSLKSGKLGLTCGDRLYQLRPETLMACSEALRASKASIMCCDFGVAAALAGPGDFVYLDPPYLHTFAGYSTEGFDASSHRALASAVERMRSRGVSVMLSGADNTDTREIYGNMYTHTVSVRETTAANGDRPMRTEIIATTYITEDTCLH
jgi:DNA adenine methylase